MTPYSQDLRKRILETVPAQRRLLATDRSSLPGQRLLRHPAVCDFHRGTGSLEPKPHGGGNPAVLGPEDLERLRELVGQQPDATLEELRQRLGASCSTMTPLRAAPAQARAAAQEEGPPAPRSRTARMSRERRREFREELAGLDPAAAGLRRRVRGQHRR